MLNLDLLSQSYYEIQLLHNIFQNLFSDFLFKIFAEFGLKNLKLTCKYVIFAIT